MKTSVTNSFKTPSILSKNISSLLFLGAVGALSSGPAAHATSDTWDGSSSALWSLSANWLTNPGVVPGLGDEAIFTRSSAAVNGNTTIDLTGGVTIGRVLFDAGGAAAYTIGTGGAGAQSLVLGDAGAISMGALTGSGQLFNAALVLGTNGATTQTFTITNASPASTLTFAGGITGSTGAGVKTLSVAGSGAVNISGVIGNGTGGTVGLLKTGNGVLTVSAANPYTGGTTIGFNQGAGVIRAAATQALGTGTITFDGVGNGSTARLELIGGITLANAVSLAGRNSASAAFQNISGNNTLSGTITINGGGANYWVQSDAGLLTLSGATAITSAATGNRTVTLRGAGDGLISGVVANGAATVALTKVNAGTWTLTGANTYTGTTTVSGGTLNVGDGTTGSLTSGALTLGGTAKINFREAAGSSQAMGALTFSAGDGTVESTYGGSGNTTLTFASLAARTLGATGNFLVTNGSNGTTNSILLTGVTANSFINHGTYFGGSAYAWNDAAGFVRAINYGTDAGAVSTGASASGLNAATYAQMTGSVTGQNTATFTTLDISGNHSLTLNASQTVTLSGILKSGNTAGGATISGGTGLTTPASGELVVRTDGINDALTISTPILNATATALTKSGNGTLTLSGANTHTGGTILNAGTLNINSAGALGNTATGGLTINGGTINNSSAGALTLSAAKAQSWNGDFTFTGTQNLNFNGGVATIGGVLGTRTVTVSAGTLSLSRIVSATGYDFTKAGAGTLALTSTANNDTTINGVLNIAGGLIQVPADIQVAGLIGSGTIENSAAGNANKWFRAGSGNGDSTFSGTIRNGAASPLGFVKQGTGTITLSGGANNVSDLITEAGRLVITGTTTATTIAVSRNAGNISSLVLNAGGTLNTTGNTNVGNGAGSNAAFTMNGGTFNSGSWMVVAGNNDRSVFNQTGGVATVVTNRMTIGAGGSGSVGVVNLSGGTFTDNAGVFIGENGTGTLNVSGTAAATVGDTRFNHAGSAVFGTLNLLGGTYSTSGFSGGPGVGAARVNFNGGTLKATGNSTTFLEDLANTTAYIYAGGGTIDSGGFNITINKPLSAPTGDGVNGIASFTPGAGYYDTPVVVISGGGGTGATAVANIAGGVLTGITITNPGIGYTSAPTFTLSGGGATTAATVTGAAPTANVGGGLTKAGSGTLTLPTINTYTGATVISAGTLALTGAGEINASSGININGSGAKLLQTSSTQITPAVTITNGTLDGTTALSAVTVTSSAGNVIANGNGGTGALTIGNLTFNDAATVNLSLSSTSPVILTTNLTTGAVNGAGQVTINATAPSWNLGTYNLISYSTLGGVGFSEFLKGTISGLSGRQNAALTNPAGFISLSITGDNPVWTGLQSGAWTTNTVPNPKNWKLITLGTPTDFLANDIVLFDDTAAGTTSVDISTANVSPLGTIFNNNSLAYTLGSTGGFGIASGTVTISGTGQVTINNANTYAGATSVNSGTLNIGNASAIGTGALNLAAGATIDNASGSPITLSTNNVINWNGNFIFGGSNALNLGTGAVALTATRTMTANGSAPLTLGGVISGTGFGIEKMGSGTLRVTGANTYTGSTVIHEGTFEVAGGTTGTTTTDVQISPNLADAGTLLVSGGVLNAQRVIIGGNTPNNGTPGSGVVTQTGGVINSQQWFTVGSGVGGGASTPTGTYNNSGGTLNVISQSMEIANFTGATGIVNLSGTGAINLYTNVSMNLGANPGAGDGTVNQNAGTVTFYSDAGITAGGNGVLRLGSSGTAAGTYTYNLNGGLLTVPQITKGAGGTGIFNFNGGTLKAAKANTAFMQGLNQALVQTGGAIIDTGTFAITILQNIDSGVVGDGGLTKLGTGTLTYTGSATYDGATTVSAGTLRLDTNGSINVSSGISINGTGAKLLQTSTIPVTPIVTINNGTLDGTTSLDAVVVTNGSGNVIANGNGTTGALTIGSLTFNNIATLNLNTASTAPVLITTALTTGAVNAAGQITVNATNTSWTNNTVYNLISYSGSIGGVGFSEFLKGTITGLTTRQSATLTNPAGFISLSIAGDSPVWTGLSNGNWTTTVISAPKNWKLITGGTQTDFLTTDTVLFDDTAAGTTTVTISDANVSPTSTTFNNTTKNYTIGGSFGIATGSLVKGGTGTVTISTNNTYTGGTTVNAGTLNMSGNNTFGAGALTVTGGTANFSGNNTYSGATTVDGGLLVMSGTNDFGTGTVTVNGGTATLQGTNTYSGLTTLNGGTLNVNHAGALGSAALVITGGTLGNTSGSDLTLATAKSQNWNGDFTYSGPNNLDFNLGNATVGGIAGTRTVNVTAGTLSVGYITAPAGFGLTKAGAGNLAMTNAANNLALNLISGVLDIQGGRVQTSTDLRIGGLTGSGTLESGHSADKWIFVNDASDGTFSGTIQDNPNNPAGHLGFVKEGAGNLDLTGALNTPRARLDIQRGKIRVTGTYIQGYDGDANRYTLVGTTSSQNGILHIDGGSYSALGTNGNGNESSVRIATAASSQGFVKLDGATSSFTSARNIAIGGGTGGAGTEAFGAFSMSGGTLTSGSWLIVSGNNNRGIFNQSGGAATVSTNRMTLGAGGANSIGVANLSGGTFNSAAGVFIGENGTGTLNMSGTSVATVGDTRFNHAASSTSGSLNLGGGTYATSGFTGGPGVGDARVNFNGGTLKATASSVTFFNDLANTTAYVYANGGTIDDGGFNITIAEALLAPTGGGVSATGVTVSGGGYIATPLVIVTGDGTGATAVANIDGSGNLTGITVTNPGINYTNASFSLVGGGVGAFGSVDTGPSIVANTSGTITKTGAGTLTLTGAQEYAVLTTTAGTTNVNVSMSNAPTVNANAGSNINFGASQTLSALNIGAGAVVTLAATPPFAPFAGGAASSAVVPEPGTVGLLLVGALGVLGRRRRSR